MIFGFISTFGIIVALVGARKLYRFTPTAWTEDGYLRFSDLHEKEILLAKHRRAWGWLIVGFLLQLVGSLGWILPFLLDLLRLMR